MSETTKFDFRPYDEEYADHHRNDAYEAGARAALEYAKARIAAWNQGCCFPDCGTCAGRNTAIYDINEMLIDSARPNP